MQNSVNQTVPQEFYCDASRMAWYRRRLVLLLLVGIVGFLYWLLAAINDSAFQYSWVILWGWVIIGWQFWVYRWMRTTPFLRMTCAEVMICEPLMPPIILNVSAMISVTQPHSTAITITSASLKPVTFSVRDVSEPVRERIVSNLHTVITNCGSTRSQS